MILSYQTRWDKSCLTPKKLEKSFFEYELDSIHVLVVKSPAFVRPCLSTVYVDKNPL
jgi:hypothetical protein